MSKILIKSITAFSYVGQGMIMGTKTGVSMLLGCILAWGVLGPIAVAKKWAPGLMSEELS
jgi:uncharacterized oligopeptide transporter (OPT) family protein